MRIRFTLTVDAILSYLLLCKTKSILYFLQEHLKLTSAISYRWYHIHNSIQLKQSSVTCRSATMSLVVLVSIASSYPSPQMSLLSAQPTDFCHLTLRPRVARRPMVGGEAKHQKLRVKWVCSLFSFLFARCFLRNS